MAIVAEEVEETLKRINSHAGVMGLVVLNPEGLAIRSTLDNTTTQLYAQYYQQLTVMAQSAIRDLDPLNSLKFLRIRTKKHEVMVSPEQSYTLLVVQNHNQGPHAH